MVDSRRSFLCRKLSIAPVPRGCEDSSGRLINIISIPVNFDGQLISIVFSITIRVSLELTVLLHWSIEAQLIVQRVKSSTSLAELNHLILQNIRLPNIFYPTKNTRANLFSQDDWSPVRLSNVHT